MRDPVNCPVCGRLATVKFTLVESASLFEVSNLVPTVDCAFCKMPPKEQELYKLMEMAERAVYADPSEVNRKFLIEIRYQMKRRYGH